MAEKSMTYRELKTLLATFTEEQLDCHIVWWGEDRGGSIKHVHVLDEPHGAPNGDNIEPLSVYKEIAEHDEPGSYDAFVKAETLFGPGQPILCEIPCPTDG